MNEVRPEKLSHVSIRDEVSAVREIEDVYRVYRPEWIVVYTSTRAPHDPAGASGAVQRCRNEFDRLYAGRVRPEDVDYLIANSEKNYAIAQLLIRKPNIKGEFKTKAQAEYFVKVQGWRDAAVVARNSKADHELRSYGVKKLAES